MNSEQVFMFTCGTAELIGILHEGAESASRGVLIVVGGPQYRVGSHRQFLLLARALAAAGIPVLRFDYRGMGDSDGEAVGFDRVDDDIAAAVKVFCERCTGVREVVIWGLCDAASAALFYAWRDPRVAGLVLLNPWVRTETGEARAYLRHYYLARLLSADFWCKIRTGKFNFGAAVRSFLKVVSKMLGRSWQSNGTNDADNTEPLGGGVLPLPERMARDLERFSGPVLVILSGDDLTAAEFKDTVRLSKHWRCLMNRAQVTSRELPEANHTFSRREWRDQVADWTLQWLRSW